MNGKQRNEIKTVSSNNAVPLQATITDSFYLLILFPFQLSFQTVEALKVVYLTPQDLGLAKY